MKLQKRRLKRETVFTLIAAAFAALLILVVCYFLKDSVLGCHDSFYDFVFARMHTFSESYHHNLEFNLARGRVGFIAAFVISIRYLVLSTGNYTAIWLLQQIPFWFTVCLLAWVIGKKTCPVYGVFFAVFFASFAQIDTNHNLLVCYPFDFMYALSLMILGLYLYDGWLCHRGEKRNVLRIILSVFLYYESMTVYEPFITACVIYALISFAHVYKKDKFGRSFINFIINLIPHAVTTIVFYGILVIIKAHPIVDSVEVTAINEYGDMTDFLNTWNTFSYAQFPLIDSRNVDVINSLRTLFAGRFIPVFCFSSAFAVIASALAVRFRSEDKQEQNKINYTLLVLAFAGFLTAEFYTVPHAMTANYQMWVRDLHAEGYLTSSVCYFGWALMFSCLLSLLINLVAHKRKALFAIVTAALAILFLIGSEVTMNSNMVYRTDDAATGQQMSYRAQAYYALYSSDYAEDYAAILIYMPGYSGVHNNMEIDDGFADFETGRELIITNDLETFQEQSLYSEYSGVFRYMPSVDAAWYTSIANPWEDPEDWFTNGNLVFVSSRPASYEFSYEDPYTGDEVSTDVDIGRMELFVIENNEPVDVDSLTITLR